LGGALAEPFTSYGDMLPNDSAWACQIPYKHKYVELQSFTNCTAIENGWCWNIPLWSRIGTGYNYSSKYVSDEEALAEFKKYLSSDKMLIPRSPEEIETYTFRNLKTRIGIHERLFVKNVVAIGLSAGFIEPLESNGLFSVHEFLFSLIKIMGRGEINEFDRLWYNNETTDMFDGFAKFVAMHYAMTLRDDTPYWKDTKNRQYKEDPSAGYIDKTIRRANAFMGAQRKFFDIWESHYTMNDGILYISAGMGYSPMTGRDLHHQLRMTPDLEENVHEVYDRWIQRENQWEDVVKEAPHMVDYMKKNFFS
jgi:tryptophan halogenase